jgi:hypothetical protein
MGLRLLLIIAFCATLLPTPSLAQANNTVSPIAWGTLIQGAPTSADALRMRSILLNANKYALTVWWNAKGYGAQTDPYLSFGGVGETNIRPPASEALALAVSLQTGAYDPSVTGVSQADARAKAIRLVGSLAYRHRATTGSGGWGNNWQTALWASLAGTAGWLLWADLSPTEQGYVRAMVEFEANRFNSVPPPSFRNAAGTVVIPGDSKGEENSWNAMILQLATAMMPAHPNWLPWMNRNLEYMLSAFARPADVSSSTVINGRTLEAWLNGSNIEPDGMMVNHDRIHPDYTATITQNANAALLSTLAGQPTPRAAFFNADIVYAALVNLQFVVGPSSYPSGGQILSPGGSIYRAGSADIYYPQVNDWGTDRRMNFAGLDAFAGAFGFDALASTPASGWEALHAQKVLDMQGRFSDGRTYGGGGEDTYNGREEWVAVLAARAYLAKWVVHQGTFTITDQQYTAAPGPRELTLDNSDPAVSISGSWSISSQSSVRIGANYLQDGNTGKGTKSITFTPNLTQAGSYEVLLYWNAASNRANNVPISVTSSGGQSTTTVNQQQNGGQWHSIGTYSFAAGSAGSVTISTTGTNGYVIADAVRFVRVGN